MGETWMIGEMMDVKSIIDGWMLKVPANNLDDEDIVAGRDAL